MNRTDNGIPTSRLSGLAWQKSRRSNPSGNCVELAELPDGGGIARAQLPGPARSGPDLHHRTRSPRSSSAPGTVTSTT